MVITNVLAYTYVYTYNYVLEHKQMYWIHTNLQRLQTSNVNATFEKFIPHFICIMVISALLVYIAKR